MTLNSQIYLQSYIPGYPTAYFKVSPYTQVIGDTDSYVLYPGVSGVTLYNQFQPEELRCEYCGRLHGRGKESCQGCGAPL